MKLWTISKLNPGMGGEWRYDCYYAHVVRAESEGQARYLAPHGDEGPEVWLDPAKTECVELTVEGEPGVILSDFLAG